MGRDPLSYCVQCNSKKPITEFRKGSTKTCKKCHSRNVMEYKRINKKTKGTKGYQVKKKLINLLGGKCYHCGLKSEFTTVYDFHHINEKTKEGNLSRMIQQYSFEKSIRRG